MKTHLPLTHSLLLTSLLSVQAISADSVMDKLSSIIPDSKDLVYVPYIFSTDSTGFAGGVGVIKQGFIQPQTIAVATLFYGAEQDILTNGQNDTANFSGGFFGIFDYRIPGTERFLTSVMGLKSYFPKARYYMYDHTNDSDENSYIESAGDMDFLYGTLKYVLPMGDGIDNPEGHYTLKHGFAVGRENYGGGTPFVTGRTSLGITGFYEHNSFDNYLPGAPRSTNGIKSWNTNGLRFFVDHDNTDYDLNPSRGYQFKLQYSKDFGWADSDQSWDFLEFKYNHYINLPTFSFTQQNVLAMSFWTGYSFSWDEESQYLPDIDTHRPPPWEGAKLGGMFRMRGYNTDRFSDKAVAYGTAEYRAILDWNPFRKNEYIPVSVDWLQVVGFAEVGRVNDTYNLDLLSDLKYDVGVSLRAMAASVPVRFDVAYSEEGVNFWVMIFQPFDF
jgi:hypothetical protein